MKKLLVVILGALLVACADAQVEGERIDVHNTVPDVCGEGPGLNPCRDVDGETFDQELNVNTTPGLDSDANLDKAVDKLKKEPIEKEIEQLEQQ